MGKPPPSETHEYTVEYSHLASYEYSRTLHILLDYVAITFNLYLTDVSTPYVAIDVFDSSSEAITSCKQQCAIFHFE